MSQTTGNVTDFSVRCTRSQSLINNRSKADKWEQFSHDDKFSIDDDSEITGLARNYAIIGGFSPSFRSTKNITLSPALTSKQESGARSVPSNLSTISNPNFSEIELNITSLSDDEVFTSKNHSEIPVKNKSNFDDGLNVLCTSFNELAIGNSRNGLSNAFNSMQTMRNEVPDLECLPPMSQVDSQATCMIAIQSSHSNTSTPVTQSCVPVHYDTGSADSPRSESLLEPVFSKDEKIDKLLLLAENNAIELTQMRSEISSFQSALNFKTTECNNRIDLIEEQIMSELNLVNKKCEDISSRLDLELNNISSDLESNLSRAQTKTHENLTKEINRLDKSHASKLSKLDRELNRKLGECNSSLSEAVGGSIKSFLSSKEGAELISSKVNETLEKKELDLGADSPLARKIYETSSVMSKAFRGEVLELVEQLKSEHRDSLEEFKLMKGSLNVFIGEQENDFSQVPKQLNDVKLFGRKIDRLTVWIESLQQQLMAKSKILSAIDVKTRKTNLILDGIDEAVLNEDLIPFIGSLLVRFVPNFDQHAIENAYRLGKNHGSERMPRRVLVAFYSTAARDLVLNSAGAIARAGPPGKRIYVNEDIPEEVKRRRADVFKYCSYMTESGYNISQKGDSVVLNNVLYKYEDLSHMPKGMTLADSRTIAKNGVISSQSPHSPFSNLFLAPIKRNGITYHSAEQAFQHAKAVTCKDHVLAKAILNEPCPIEFMSIGKRVEINDDWGKRQLEDMRSILRLKMDQVPAFATLLKASDKHHLVENTRSIYWGAGTPYNSDLIHNRSYPGQNKLGFLLEEVRELL